MGLLDYIGDLDAYVGDDEMVGAPVRRRRRQMPFYQRGGGVNVTALAQRAQGEMRDRRVMAAQVITPAAPGVPKPGPREEPLGFPAFAFVNAGATSVAQTTRPQKPFKGARLVIDIARTGATATGLITVVSLLIGSRNVLVNANPIGAAAFAANAFGVQLSMDEAVPGIDIVLTLATSAAPGVGDRIDVAATIIGLTWS